MTLTLTGEAVWRGGQGVGWQYTVVDDVVVDVVVDDGDVVVVGGVAAVVVVVKRQGVEAAGVAVELFLLLLDDELSVVAVTRHRGCGGGEDGHVHAGGSGQDVHR